MASAIVESALFVSFITRLSRWSKQPSPLSIFLVILGTADSMLVALLVTQNLVVDPSDQERPQQSCQCVLQCWLQYVGLLHFCKPPELFSFWTLCQPNSWSCRDKGLGFLRSSSLLRVSAHISRGQRGAKKVSQIIWMALTPKNQELEQCEKYDKDWNEREYVKRRSNKGKKKTIVRISPTKVNREFLTFPFRIQS